jgi:hypothetical protein
MPSLHSISGSKKQPETAPIQLENGDQTWDVMAFVVLEFDISVHADSRQQTIVGIPRSNPQI